MEEKLSKLFQPKKILGQHFLIDKKALSKIIQSAELSPQDIILEIGPGLGQLTFALAPKVKKIIAIEKDKRLFEILKEKTKKRKIKLILGDILKIFPEKLPLKTQKYKVVANIPYYLTSNLIRRLLEAKNPPQLIVLLVQKEVAQRICAKPPQMNLLAVAVQYLAQPKIIAYVSKKSFWPRPQVDSAILKIIPQRKKLVQKRKKFFQIVKAGFVHPRKLLLNNLAQELKINKEKLVQIFTQLGFDLKLRAEALSVGEWEKLAQKLSLDKFKV